MILRDYQIRDGQKVRLALSQHRSVLYTSPTGSGKTTLVADFIEDWIGQSLRIGFVAHRKELIDQCSQRLTQHGITHGIIMAGRAADPDARVQVCSIQTLTRREPPQLDRLVVDEAHHAPSETYRRLTERYASILGLTATPCRMDGRGLGSSFDTLVLGSSALDLTLAGFLVPCRVYAPATPDLGGVHSQAGDYIVSELQAAMDKPKITGDIVAHWLKLAAGRPTVVFATGVQHSLKITEAFKSAGIRAAHIDADTPKDLREAILDDLASKRLEIVSNCGILTEGWDCPVVSCIVLARPTRSLALYLQLVGRSLRPAPGKVDCLILDHAGATLRHGFVTEDHKWSLDPSVRVGQSKDDSPSVRLCLRCYMAYESSLGPCPSCGFAPPAKVREVREANGELQELKEVKPLSRNPQIRQLQEIQRLNKYKPGFIWFNLQRMRRGLPPQIPANAKRPNERNSFKKQKVSRTRRPGGRRRLREARQLFMVADTRPLPPVEASLRASVCERGEGEMAANAPRYRTASRWITRGPYRRKWAK